MHVVGLHSINKDKETLAAIGSISLTINGALDAGLALLLVKPPKIEHEFHHAGAIFRASPDTPFIVCCFSGAKSHIEAVNIGSNLIQEGLDLLSMTGGADLATRDANEEYVAWWNADGESTIAYVSTVTSSVSIGPSEVTVRDANGNIVPPNIIVPQHHLGFRFYRLAQVSDDLFDAYRNMYLAFEALLSSQYPKGRGLEIDWLRSSLTAASNDLTLTSVVPGGTPSPVDHILDIVYGGARLPLFHAKDGRTYFAPTGSANDRGVVAVALRLLTKVVIRMADVWFNAHRRSGWVNLKIFEEQNKTLFARSKFVYSDNQHYTLQDDFNSQSIKEGYRFNGQFHEEFAGEPRHNVYGCLDVSSIRDRGRLYALYLISGESVQLSCSPDTTFDLSGFNRFEVFFFLRGNNASRPKYLYSR